MAALKCKMCGGDLNVIENTTVCVCEYCGTKQTVPSLDNEKKLALFQRANRLRFNSEFDKAYSIYETVITDYPEEAEAYWGLVLCKYGVEYVDDPKTKKKIPTCHRSSFESVMDDPNFELALEYSDLLSRTVYREEAKALEEIRKGIIEISSKEEPYDIFICYKETDARGERTIDSVIAEDVYEALTDRGYRVFFSRITLEDKLGKEYEPYIFSALHSAKIMLVFGTDYEHFNAVWVKNEWSRFLKLIENDKEKTLIPCYKGIDAYDMPREFAKLQAQDMGKVGAMQDLLRGIEKILPHKRASQPQIVTVSQGAPTGDFFAPILKRAEISLKEYEFERAKQDYKKVLDFMPDHQEALLGVFLCEMRVTSLEALAKGTELFCREYEYKELLKTATEETKKKLIEAHEKIIENNRTAFRDTLKAKNFERASFYAESLLEFEPENEEMLLGLLLIEQNASSLDELANGTEFFCDTGSYTRLVRSCGEEMKSSLAEAHERVKENNKTVIENSLNEKNFGNAIYYAKNLLAYEPENPDANTALLLAECKASKIEELALCEQPISSAPSYNRCIELAKDKEEILNAKAEQNKRFEAEAKTKRRRLIKIVSIASAALVAICLTVGISLAIYSNSDSYIFGVEYENGEAIITRYNGNDTEVIIPDEINGKPVTTIASDAFYNCNSLTSVTIPDSVTTIGDSAFRWCDSLTSVTIGNSVTTIGISAFRDCASLTSIIIPDSVTCIRNFAFRGCDSLTIYCEAASEPNGWKAIWKDSNCPVVWGCIGE